MTRKTRPRGFSRLVTIALLVATLGAGSLLATTFISVEPIPSEQVVGEATLATILSAGYENLELWSNRLLDDCDIVDDVIDALTDDEAITTVTDDNTTVRVAAGGFEGITNPAYVFTVKDSGRGAVSAADVNVLDNAMGYVLNQGGTVHFSPDNPEAYDFPLDYAVVSHRGRLEGLEAKAFFEHVGTIDPALFSGSLAGFTQINNSMLFLQPAAPRRQFVQGLSAAADSFPGATYSPLNKHGKPTTASAGIAFPGNDWIAFPDGDQYLSQLGNPSPALLRRLSRLRNQHLAAVRNLEDAIEAGDVERYLKHHFRCPAR